MIYCYVEETFAADLLAAWLSRALYCAGRILNKFGADMDQIDVQLPESLESVLTMMFFTLVTLVVISVVLPWFLVALAIVLIGCGRLLCCIAMPAMQHLLGSDA